MNTTAPPVSVVMAVHNGMPHVETSVRSILAQTFTDFEFVIGDDGSSDGSTEVLRKLATDDPRMRLLRRDSKSGLAASANWVVREARAPLVAMMHADDRAYPERLARQVPLFAQASDVQLIGTLCEGIDDHGRRVRAPDYWQLTRRSAFAPFGHASIMFRRSAFDEVGGYRPEAEYWEDLDLYIRIAALGRILVIPKTLTSIRFSRSSARLTNDADRVDEAVDLMYRSVADYLRGGDYPQRFPRGGVVAPGAKLSPETFIGRGSVQLWAGRPPRLFRRMWRRADLGCNLYSLQVVLWTFWSSLSPKSMRLLLQSAMRLRMMTIAPELRRQPFVEWDPSRAPLQVADAAPVRAESPLWNGDPAPSRD